MNIVLFEPEIPPNTGNIARLCAATGTDLHLIEPLGFKITDKHLKRAGLDYWPHVNVRVWPDWNAFDAHRNGLAEGRGRLIMTSSNGGAAHHEFAFRSDDWLVFGPETRGLPDAVLRYADCCVRIPIWGKVRSLNLSTSAGIILYAAYASCGELDGK